MKGSLKLFDWIILPLDQSIFKTFWFDDKFHKRGDNDIIGW